MGFITWIIKIVSKTDFLRKSGGFGKMLIVVKLTIKGILFGQIMDESTIVLLLSVCITFN